MLKEVIQLLIFGKKFLTFFLMSCSPGADDEVMTTGESKQTTNVKFFNPKYKVE